MSSQRGISGIQLWQLALGDSVSKGAKWLVTPKAKSSLSERSSL
jgi:hypothetical protein